MTNKSIFPILGIGALVTLLSGLWLVSFLIIICMIVLFVRNLFLSSKHTDVEEPAPIQDKPSIAPTERDVRNLAYHVILRRVTEIVTRDYPDARWIWEAPNIREILEHGGEMFILLNRAGGFRRAKVIVSGLCVLGIEYQAVQETDNNQSDKESEAPDIEFESQEENYELLAFEWVEAHIMELNERCNEAIGQGITELLLKAEELPASESWQDICKELKRADICKVKIVSEGIKINLMQ